MRVRRVDRRCLRQEAAARTVKHLLLLYAARAAGGLLVGPHLLRAGAFTGNARQRRRHLAEAQELPLPPLPEAALIGEVERGHAAAPVIERQ